MKIFFQTHKELIIKTAVICGVVFCAIFVLEIVSEVIDFIFD